jgi:hypothetical protein
MPIAMGFVAKEKTGEHRGSPVSFSQSNPGRLLPAPAATTAAVTAAIAAVPASTTTATSATAARPPTAATAGSSATATAGSPATAAVASTTTATRSSATAASTTFARRTGFVDNDVAAHEIVTVQSLHGTVCFFVAIDLDKSEPARLP